MHRTGLMSILIAFALARAPVASTGQIPDPTRCEVDPCLILCPAGDPGFRVVARRVTNALLANAFVDVRLCSCSGVHLASTMATNAYHLVDSCSIQGVTNAAGIVDFFAHGGGVCAGSSIGIFVNGVAVATHDAVASPDQNGDLVVDDADLAVVAAKRGNSDPTADFDCDGEVTDADLAIAQAHFGHTALNATPALPSTWGQIKAIYR